MSRRTIICPRCGRAVPAANFPLHKARCDHSIADETQEAKETKTNNWACPACTYLNDLAHDSCTMCGSTRDPVPSAPVRDTERVIRTRTPTSSSHSSLPPPHTSSSLSSSSSSSSPSLSISVPSVSRQPSGPIPSSIPTSPSSSSTPSSPGSYAKIAASTLMGVVLGGCVGAMSSRINNRSVFGGFLEGAFAGGAAGAGLAVVNSLASANEDRAASQTPGADPGVRRPVGSTRRVVFNGGGFYYSTSTTLGSPTLLSNDPGLAMFLRTFGPPGGGRWEMDTEGMSHEELIRRFGMGNDFKGASSTVIDSLPTYTYDETKQEKEEKNKSEGNKDTDKAKDQQNKTCVICMDEFAKGDKLRNLPCFHSYHQHCIDCWLRTNATCPICKHEVR